VIELVEKCYIDFCIVLKHRDFDVICTCVASKLSSYLASSCCLHCIATPTHSIWSYLLELGLID